MAIAYDNSAVSDASDGSGCCGNFSFSYTCSGTDRLLIVAVHGDSTQQSTAVTYNGVSMTSLTGDHLANNTSGANSLYAEVWYLVNPASGSNTLSISRNGYGRAVVASYTGVKQTGFPDSYNISTGAGNPQSVSTTVVASSCWLIGVGIAPMSTSGITARINTGGTTRIASGVLRPSSIWQDLCIGDSNGTVGTGSQSMSFDNTSAANYYSNGGCVISIAPAVAKLPPRQWQSIAKIRAATY